MSPFGRLSTSTKAGAGPRAGKPVCSAIRIHFPSHSFSFGDERAPLTRLDLQEGHAKRSSANHFLHWLVAISSALLFCSLPSLHSGYVLAISMQCQSLGQCLMPPGKIHTNYISGVPNGIKVACRSRSSVAVSQAWFLNSNSKCQFMLASSPLCRLCSAPKKDCAIQRLQKKEYIGTNTPSQLPTYVPS